MRAIPCCRGKLFIVLCKFNFQTGKLNLHKNIPIIPAETIKYFISLQLINEKEVVIDPENMLKHVFKWHLSSFDWNFPL